MKQYAADLKQQVAPSIDLSHLDIGNQIKTLKAMQTANQANVPQPPANTPPKPEGTPPIGPPATPTNRRPTIAEQERAGKESYLGEAWKSKRL